MLDALASSSNLMMSQSFLLQQLQQWLSRAATPITLLLASAILGSLLKWSRRQVRSPGPLPPSPGIALPVLGHLHLMKSGADPRKTFSELRSKLGDIFSFYAGSRLIVVLNGYDVIHEALVKKATVFSHRAHTFMSEKMGQGRGIVNTSGTQWREQRQFAERTLRTLRAGRCSVMSHKIQREVDCLLECLDQACSQGQAVDPAPLLMASFSNIMISIIYGHRFDMKDPKFCHLMQALKNCFENFGNTEPLNFFPLVRFLPGDPYRYWFCIQNMNFIESQLVYPEVSEHERKLDNAEGEDVITAYLREMSQKRTNGTPTSMDKENLVKVAGDLLAGGAEPPSTTNLWLLLYMVRFPDVQEKCYQELLAVLGKDRAPTLEDRGSLPYLEATINEVQRHADVGPLAMAHGLARDTEFRGYHLPKDAIVLINIHSVHHEVEAWGDPEVFRPERFLGDDGKLKRHPSFMPYSMGPRVCPGENLARMELFLYCASILHRYRLVPDGPVLPPLEGKMALLHTPSPFSLRFQRRH